jgi:hypothetical protein
MALGEKLLEAKGKSGGLDFIESIGNIVVSIVTFEALDPMWMELNIAIWERRY